MTLDSMFDKPGEFLTVAEIKKANKAIGGYFFSQKTMKSFGTEIVGAVFGGRFLVIADDNFDGTRKDWKVVYVWSDGRCDYLPGVDWPTLNFETVDDAIALALNLEVGKPEVIGLRYRTTDPVVTCDGPAGPLEIDQVEVCSNPANWTVDGKGFCYKHVADAILIRAGEEE